MVTARQDLAEMARARSNVYGFLASVFRAEPSAAFVERLRDPAFAEALAAMGVDLGGDFLDPSGERLTQSLAVEYTRLFIGPGPHVSPHESVHLEARGGPESSFWGPETVQVKKFIEATGLALDDDFPGMPDHVSAELELMQRLAEREAEAWAAGEADFADELNGIEKRFFDEHLSQWLPRFCDRVIDAAALAFYRQMAVVTKDFLAFESSGFAPQVESARAEV
jgi:TorA maturation chaperone TorD